MDQPLESRDYYSEYLTPHQDVVAHAIGLFSAGSVESVVSNDQDFFSGPFDAFFSLFLFALWSPLLLLNEFRLKSKFPHKPFFRPVSHGRNKLMVFRHWLVRCTWQKFDESKQADLFYFSGVPLKDVISIGIGNDYINISGKSCGNFGGRMGMPKTERDHAIDIFSNLHSAGRLHPDARLGV